MLFAVILTLTFLLEASPTVAAALAGEKIASASAGAHFSERELDLLGADVVSHRLLYNGFYNANDRHLPRLLTGAATTRFWPLSQPVMALAPQRSATVQGHDTDVLLFRALEFASLRITTVDANSVRLSGDGLEFCLFVSPLRTKDWETPYYATDPEGANETLAPVQGDVLFPYSLTPYVVVQWDPAYSTAHGEKADFNLYLVSPLQYGTVGPLPHPDDLLNSNVSFHRGSGTVRVAVTNRARSETHFWLHVNLTRSGFVPPVLGGSTYFFGLGGSGNYPAGWGTVFIDFQSWSDGSPADSWIPSEIRIGENFAATQAIEAGLARARTL